MNNGPAYLNIGEVAEALGVSRRTVYTMIRAGKLTAIPSPIDAREKLIARSEIDELLKFAREPKKLAA